jgi:hypothetical protein
VMRVTNPLARDTQIILDGASMNVKTGLRGRGFYTSCA